MTNLLVTSVCNQQCAYCFTADRRAPRRRFLSLPAFRERLAFLERSGMDRVRLLGGEPTLHPRFAELVAAACQAGKGVTVFSNGLMPPAALACLEALPARECNVIVNVTPAVEGGGNGRVLERQRETLRRLGRRAMPGLNFCRSDLRPDLALDLVAATGCRRAVRVSLAHAVLSGGNQHLHPRQYRAVAAKIVAFARRAAAVGVRLEMDCGFVRCMFAPTEIDDLRQAGADLDWRCNPILDVDLDGRVVPCLPLAGLVSLPLTPEADAASLRAAFEARTRHYRRAGVFPECSTCSFKASGDCSGGCLAATIRRFRPATVRLEVPA